MYWHPQSCICAIRGTGLVTNPASNFNSFGLAAGSGSEPDNHCRCPVVCSGYSQNTVRHHPSVSNNLISFDLYMVWDIKNLNETIIINYLIIVILVIVVMPRDWVYPVDNYVNDGISEGNSLFGLLPRQY